MYSQGSVSICHEQSNTEISDGACKDSRVERESSEIYAKFFPNFRYFCLHNYMNKSRNKFSIFKDLAQASLLLPFQISQMVVGALVKVLSPYKQGSKNNGGKEDYLFYN